MFLKRGTSSTATRKLNRLFAAKGSFPSSFPRKDKRSSEKSNLSQKSRSYGGRKPDIQRSNGDTKWWLMDVEKYKLDMFGEYKPWWSQQSSQINKELLNATLKSQISEWEKRGFTFSGPDEQQKEQLDKLMSIYSMSDQGFQEAIVTEVYTGDLPSCYPETYEEESFLRSQQ